MSPTEDQIAARRADIDAKQDHVADLLAEMNCEALLLLMPAHVAWFTAGLTARGLIADSERPGVYTNGRQRWLLCSNVDTQRLFDEEIDQLGFQLKEWTWAGGRSELLFNITSGRKVAADRPFPNVPMANDRLRPLLRVLSPYERARYHELGAWVAHSVEATARTVRPGDREDEVAGQLGHRLLHHGIEPAALCVTADGRGAKFRRSGYTSAPITTTCVIQATGQRDGLFATAARTVSFGPPPDDLRVAYDLAREARGHLLRSYAQPGATLAQWHDRSRPDRPGRHAVRVRRTTAEPNPATGRVGSPRKSCRPQLVGDEPPGRRAGGIGPGNTARRAGPAACADTVIVTDAGPEAVTPPMEWPFKRITVRGATCDVPDLLVRNDE